MGRAVRDTQQAVQTTQAVVQALPDRVENLRRELGLRIDQLDAKVDDAAICAARVEGQIGILIDTLRQDREEAKAIRVTTVTSAIEVEKTGEIAKINEGVSVRADRRQIVLKAMAVLGPIAAAAITYLLSHC